MVMMIAAPSTHAHTAPGPASPAARHAPNSHPEPMIEPSPVSIRAKVPTSRRMGLGEFMRTFVVTAEAAHHARRDRGRPALRPAPDSTRLTGAAVRSPRPARVHFVVSFQSPAGGVFLTAPPVRAF